MVKLKKGELISYKKSSNFKKRLGIVVSDPYMSKGEMKIKTYCDGNVYSNTIDSIGRVGDDVEIIKPNISGY
jgi:hypothetical protein